MPGIIHGNHAGNKRKREDGLVEVKKTKRRVTESDPSEEDDIQAEILLLEENVLRSRKNYNDISKLLQYVYGNGKGEQSKVIASVALCRIFCRLMAAGSLVKSRDLPEDESTIVQWLKERYEGYKNELLRTLEHTDTARQSTALMLLMRLMKEEKANSIMAGDAVWRTGLFADVVQKIIGKAVADDTRTEFIEKYAEKYDDVRYYTFECLASMGSHLTGVSLQKQLSMLAAIKTSPKSEEELKDFFVGPPSKAKTDLFSLTAHRRQLQKAWMSVLRNDISKSQRKTVLELVSHQIAPQFLKVELLMDFLTDSFNVGGSTSLMALSGLFYLIQHKNLDYPQFYQKLYSLLDSSILHSKHRSRFFRLLDTFLASTHLPAALVASFIKRLSRLTLHAPPSGIVVVVPWIYNLLKSHPSCTFMIHRNGDGILDEDGWGDPFQAEALDPMETNALESSLWEIHMLQNHYHPNVAAIARLISEQFTKEAYDLEDFLDHSYSTMLDAELSKELRKPPEVEYEIPKKIFTRHDPGSGKEDSILVKLWTFG